MSLAVSTILSSSFIDNPVTRFGFAVFIATLGLGFILPLLPNTPMPQEVGIAFNYMFTLFYSFNFVIPVNSILTLFRLSIFMELGIGSMYLFLFLYRMVNPKK